MSRTALAWLLPGATVAVFLALLAWDYHGRARAAEGARARWREGRTTRLEARLAELRQAAAQLQADLGARARDLRGKVEAVVAVWREGRDPQEIAQRRGELVGELDKQDERLGADKDRLLAALAEFRDSLEDGGPADLEALAQGALAAFAAWRTEWQGLKAALEGPFPPPPQERVARERKRLMDLCGVLRQAAQNSVAELGAALEKLQRQAQDRSAAASTDPQRQQALQAVEELLPQADLAIKKARGTLAEHRRRLEAENEKSRAELAGVPVELVQEKIEPVLRAAADDFQQRVRELEQRGRQGRDGLEKVRREITSALTPEPGRLLVLVLGTNLLVEADSSLSEQLQAFLRANPGAVGRDAVQLVGKDGWRQGWHPGEPLKVPKEQAQACAEYVNTLRDAYRAYEAIRDRVPNKRLRAALLWKSDTNPNDVMGETRKAYPEPDYDVHLIWLQGEKAESKLLKAWFKERVRNVSDIHQLKDILEELLQAAP